MKRQPLKRIKREAKIPVGNTMVSSRTLRARLLSSLASEIGNDLTFSRASSATGRCRNVDLQIVGTDEPLFGRRGLYLEDVRTNNIGLNIFDPNLLYGGISLDNTKTYLVAGPSGSGNSSALHLSVDIDTETESIFWGYMSPNPIVSCRAWIKFERPINPECIPCIQFLTLDGGIIGYLISSEENFEKWIEFSGHVADIEQEGYEFIMRFCDYKTLSNDDFIGNIQTGDVVNFSLSLHAESIYPVGQSILNFGGEPATSAQGHAYVDVADVPVWNSSYTIAFRLFINGLQGHASGDEWRTVFIVNGEDEGEQRAIYIHDDGTIRARCGEIIPIESEPGLIKNGGSYEIVYTTDGADLYLWVDGILIDTVPVENPGGTVTGLEFVGKDWELSDLNIYSEHADTAQKVKYALEAE